MGVYVVGNVVFGFSWKDKVVVGVFGGLDINVLVRLKRSYV